MFHSSVICRCILALLLTAASLAQDTPKADNPIAPPAVPPAKAESNKSPAPIKAVVHHVVVDVIAKDKHGRPVRDLTEKDFQIFERVDWVGKVQEKIADFRLVDKSAPSIIPAGTLKIVQIPAGTYSNIAAVREPDAPLTVILIDELNTDMSLGVVRQQIMKMADEVADFNVPTCVLLLGNRLQMVQNFSSDGKQLRSTIHSLMKAGPFGGSQFTSFLAPSPAMQQQLGVANSFIASLGQGAAADPSSAVHSIKDLSRLRDAYNRDMHVLTTVDVMRTISRYLAGYPGRKKLVWISSAFPFSIFVTPGADSDEPLSYREQVKEATNALSDAQVAVYPIRPGGGWLPDVFTAARKDAPVASDPRTPQLAFGDELARQSIRHNAENATLVEVAGQTGGDSCLDSNDLGFCLKKALDDGYTYYEIAYYPPANTWKEGFHKISVLTTRPGVRLDFRQGYYATGSNSPEGEQSSAQRELKQAACQDVMTATRIPLTIVPLSPNQNGTARFSITVGTLGPTGLAQPTVDADQNSALEFAACTFNAEDKPLQYGKIPAEEVLGHDNSSGQNGFHRIFAFDADPHATQIRWVVRNKENGELGSVDLPYKAIQAGESKSTDTSLAAVNVEQKIELPVIDENASSPRPSSTNPPPKNLTSDAGPMPKLEDDTEVAAYCEGLAQPGANAEALAKVCEYALSLKKSLPDLLCRRTARKHWRAGGSAAQEDVATLVAYQNGIEYDSDLLSSGTHTGPFSLHRVGNSSSSGEFAATLQAIFLPRSNANFTFEKEQMLGPVPVLVFDYVVARQDNGLYSLVATYVSGKQVISFPGYRGRLYIEKLTFHLLRLERETNDVESRFPINYTSTLINYSDVALGNGAKFVLPANADTETCSPNEGKECAHNLVDYDECHMFHATSRILATPPTEVK